MIKTELNDNISVGDGEKLLLISGPCVIESETQCLDIARQLKAVSEELGLNYVFKASFDKANRTSINSYRGPGLTRGLEILKTVKDELSIPVLTDLHETSQVEKVADVCDILQIPAFLCRQTDLLLESAKTGRCINVKKGQFLAPAAMRAAVEKILSTGNKRLLLCERGSSFGYGNLVVDMRSLIIMRELGVPVIMDATHSVQMPGTADTTGGNRDYVPVMVNAAAAVGVDGFFIEAHPNPDQSKSDAANSVHLADMKSILSKGKAIHELVNSK